MTNELQLSDKITVGGAPDAAAIADLKARGFTTIINLRTPDEPNYAAEEGEVEGAGLDYAAIPISPTLIDDIAVDRFMGAIISSDGPVAVHCKSGGRAGMMSLLHLGVSHGWSLEKTYAEGEKMGVKLPADSPYRAFFESYIQRHSAGERSEN